MCSAASRDWARRKCSNFAQRLFTQLKFQLYRIVIGTAELGVYNPACRYRYIIGNDEAVQGYLKVGFRIPWCIRITAAWYWVFRIKRSLQAEMLRQVFFLERLCPGIFFAGNTEDFRGIA